MWILLWADYREVSRGLRQDSMDYRDFVMLGGFIAGVVLLVWLLQAASRRVERWKATSPRALFGELAKAHRLSVGERRMLLRLARHRGESMPARLFVDSTLWPDDAGEAVAELRSKLFDSGP